ncbi:MAG: TonB-dependent receptor [Gammaproteobacteria bacterium]
MIPQLSYAEEQTESEDAPLLETVEVTVPSQAERSKSVTIISKHQMEGQHFMNINDVLFSMNPGVTMNRRSNLGFMGGGSATKIRGLNRERVVVFVDGIPQQVNNHFHPLYDSYTPDMIDRIEITRGSSSVLHGASAIGGVIDIYTYVPQKQGTNAYVSGSYGRFDTIEQQSQMSYRGENGYWVAGNTFRRTDGDRLNSEFIANTINVKGVYFLNPEWEVGFRFGQTKAEIEDPGTVTAPSLSKSTQDPTNAAVTLDRRTASSSSLIAFYWSKNVVESLVSGGGAVTGFDRFDEDEYGFRSKHTWLLGTGKTATIGFDAVTYDDKRKGSAAAQAIKRNEEFYSPYGAFTWSFGNFLIDGGVRYTESPSYDSDISPEVGLVYKVDPSLALRARWGEGYRVPRAPDISVMTINPDIAPEDFWVAEIGLNKTFDSRVVFDIAAWHMQGDNLLFTKVTGPLTGVLVNTGEFEHWGIESSLDIRLLDDLTAFIGVAVMDIDQITQAPNQTVDFGLEYLRGPFRATLTSRYAADSTDISGGATVDLPNYYVADLHLGYQMTRYAEAFVDIDNITNDDYETIAGFPQVPRAVFGGIRVNFGSSSL